MARITTADPKIVAPAVADFLSSYPGDLICARQLWYEGLEGHGIASPEMVEAIEAGIAAVPGWVSVGDVRYEKFGAQNSYALKR
jgi:hypothetical protein